MTLLVTGAYGFIGAALYNIISNNNISVRGSVRSLKSVNEKSKLIAVGDINADTDWTNALKNVDKVIHLASRVHLVDNKQTDAIFKYRQVNVEGTANLARQANAMGVKRFIFISSIKVNGEFTNEGRPFTENDIPSPKDPYGISKLEAEIILRQISKETGLDVVIIRPPLVYGPGVKANFDLMLRFLIKGIPLPLGAVTFNRRSFVGLDNLVDFIMICLNHHGASNQTFLVSDGEDISTVELLQLMGAAMGQSARLFYVPPTLLNMASKMINKQNIYQRLCSSLQVDISKSANVLNWKPPLSVYQGLQKIALGFNEKTF